MKGRAAKCVGTIFVIEESPHDAKTMYVGTDDGNVQLTKDGGATWTNVTPPTAGDGLVNELEVSPHDPGTVYVAYRKDRVGDPAPYIYRSTDFGKTWTTLVNGLRAGEPVRVVREDPERKGLMYAGTETTVYISYDGGARWQLFAGNLPVVPVTDLEVRHGDLIASTEGRAFWILDDLSVIRQHADSLASAAAHLYQPRTALLVGGGGGFGGGAGANMVGRNPRSGAVINYRLASAPDSATTVRLEFLDSKGAVVRSYSNKEGNGTVAPRSQGWRQHLRLGPAPPGADDVAGGAPLWRPGGRCTRPAGDVQRAADGGDHDAHAVVRGEAGSAARDADAAAGGA
ncbi:MAG: exo-alpha-sialidase [Gemmatimonadetes bacterium]|nr:exo-alpha-sialidase [Gemmatimonadota bacterium]